MRRIIPAIMLAVAAAAWCDRAAADEALHARIDRHIADAASGHPLAAVATDSEFVRRVYLDFAGRIPTIAQTRAFLDDKAADKRTKLIDKLLAGEDYPRHMANLFHVMLMERRGDHDGWLKFLQRSFAANKPWDQLAREILNPSHDDEATRDAGFFYTKRLEKYGQNPIDFPGLTRDVGRLFMGMDLQCAQCHDHVHIDDYKQPDFQGLYTVYLNVAIDRNAKFPAVVEGVMTKKIEFRSVFKSGQHETGPRVPGMQEIAIAVFEKGDEWRIAPDRKAKQAGVPKFSPLSELAKQLPMAQNRPFVRNIVNRLWFIMMGRGLVHPLDRQHSGNPPSHPALLELLADQFIAHKFDMKWLLRELALTQTYQRSSLLPDGADKAPVDRFTVAIERHLSAEQLLASVLVATGERDRIVKDEKQYKELRDRFLKAFANAPKQPEVVVNPTLKAALFFRNDDKLLDLLHRRDGNSIDHLAKLDDAGVADELYLSILSRRPTGEERADVQAYLKEHGSDRDKALRDAAWALLASAEFFVNH